MDIDEIKQLVQLMVDNDLSELDIADGDKKIALKRGKAPAPVIAAPAIVPVASGVSAAAPAAAPAPAAQPPAPEPAEKLIEIRSPMVGTFYAAPSPDTEAFVQPGTRVSDDSVVCIVEAMKVMNEIKAECSGEIVEVCVRNAQPVEYGQVLFRVRAL
ncbi:MAG: acetyl-CoA carboxylase biotin carboxyl carrier protein [Phycisphaerae bacterium]